MRIASASVVATLAVLVAACGGGGVKNQPKQGGKHVEVVEQKKTQTVAFGEPVQQGDAAIVVVDAVVDTYAGQHYGQFRPFAATLVRLQVKNASEGKIIEWPGWHGVAVVEDEHKNKFAPLSLRGWSWLPRNEPHDGWDGDTGAKIAPGATYVNALYHEPAPATSKTITVTIAIGDRTVKFVGTVGRR